MFNLKPEVFLPAITRYTGVVA